MGSVAPATGSGGGRTPRAILQFDAPELFLFGSPLAIMLLHRQMLPGSRLEEGEEEDQVRGGGGGGAAAARGGGSGGRRRGEI